MRPLSSCLECVCFVPSLALVEFVALTLSEAAVTSAGGGGDGAVEDCDEADIEDPGSRAVVKSVRKVVESFDNWLRSAARPDVDDDDDADDELAEEVDDDDEDDFKLGEEVGQIGLQRREQAADARR